MTVLLRIWRKLIELVRELSDETAYLRYLKQEGIAHSARAWRAFADQRHARKYRSAKCC